MTRAASFHSRDAVRQIGRQLGLPESKIYGVATFYNQFRFTPLGKHHIQICRGTACHVKGSAMVKERELRRFLDNLRRPPALVITDSQAFLKVSADTPKSVPMTSFSILFARLKGDLETFAKGAMHIDKLTPGSRVLIAEACTHHPVGEDIGRGKIPRWLTQYVGGELDFTVVSGHDFPSDLSSYELVVHCGSCTFNRRELLSRILRCGEAGVPITNYGITMAYALGIFERALAPFPNVAKTIGKRQ